MPTPIITPSLQRSTSAKMFIVAILGFACVIPSIFIYGLVSERQGRFREAVNDISTKWASNQIIAGPTLVVPYTSHTVEQGRTIDKTEYLSIAPENVKANVHIETEMRRRGIFEVPVYTATVAASGVFYPLSVDLNGLDRLQWANATIVTGVSDGHGFTQEPMLFVGNKEPVPTEGAAITGTPFQPGSAISMAGVSSTMHAGIGVNIREPLHFSYTMTLHGTEALEFMPVGKRMEVSMSSPWLSPSFVGMALPEKYEITKQGFTATWGISPWWAQGNGEMTKTVTDEYGTYQQPYPSTFGVKLIDTVGFYTLIERSVKYAILFIALTFMVFFLAEVLTHTRVHPFQYLLVGAALCLFYLLLLSLSEHLGFMFAYLASTIATVGLISWFSASVLASRKFAKIVGGLLVVLYAYLYTLLQLEDYALLIGSVVLFAILAAVMYVTRKIDWYGLDQQEA